MNAVDHFRNWLANATDEQLEDLSFLVYIQLPHMNLITHAAAHITDCLNEMVEEVWNSRHLTAA